MEKSEKIAKDGLFERVGVRYEVACDVIGSLIAHYAEMIAKERDKEQPDLVVLQASIAKKDALADERNELDSRDTEAIEKVISRYAPLARQLYEIA